MLVNKSHYLTQLWLVLLFCSATISLAAQGPVGGYKELITAKGIAVEDTVEGIDLQVITIEPSANHGNVDIHLIAAGSNGTPNRYRVHYTPNPGFYGIDTFTLELNQFFTFPHLHYLAYRVAVYPSLITLKYDYATTFMVVSITVHVLGNDQCNNGPLTLSDIPVVNHGTAGINAQNQVVFSPKPGFSGVAQLNYVACDPSGNCKTGQLNIGVRPVGQPGNTILPVATAQNIPTQIPLQYSGYTLMLPPAHGTVQVINGRAFRYTPDAGYTGADPFVLRRAVNNTAYFLTVDMKVLQTSPQNKMAVNDYVYTPVGTPVSFNVRQNDLGNLSVTQWGGPNAGGSLINTTSDGHATFIPDPDFTGAAVFQYTLGNGIADYIETATVNVVVTNLNPAYDTFRLTTPRQTPFVVEYPIPYATFDFEISSLPAHGNCQFYPGYSSQIVDGQTVSGNNLLIYYPDEGFWGEDIFEINYCLAANAQCKNTVIRMQVTESGDTGSSHCLQDCIWPGDANADGIVNNKDLLTLGFSMGQKGPQRPAGSTGWFAQQGNNWSNSFVPLQTDLKNADADGNGHITELDADPIRQHYGHTDNLVPASPLIKKGLPFFFHLLTPGASVGDLVEVEVSLGSPTNPVTNLYGMTFDAVLSSNIVDSAFKMEYYDNSWINLNSPFLSLSVSPNPARLESAFTRTNGQPVSGYGVIGKFSFIIIDIVDVGRPDDLLFYNLILSNSSVQWGDGVVTSGSSVDLQIPLGNINERAAPAAPICQMQVYPSPAHSIIQVDMPPGDLLQSVALFDLNGRMVQQVTGLSSQRTTLDVSQLPNGLYVVAAQTAQGTVVRKVTVFRGEK